MSDNLIERIATLEAKLREAERTLNELRAFTKNQLAEAQRIIEEAERKEQEAERGIYEHPIFLAEVRQREKAAVQYAHERSRREDAERERDAAEYRCAALTEAVAKAERLIAIDPRCPDPHAHVAQLDIIGKLGERIKETERERDEARAALHDTPAGKLIVAVLGKEVHAVEDERDRLQAENESLKSERAAALECSRLYFTETDALIGRLKERLRNGERLADNMIALIRGGQAVVTREASSVLDEIVKAIDQIRLTLRETSGEKGGGRG